MSAHFVRALFVLGSMCILANAQQPGSKEKADGKKLDERVREIAGSAEFLRSVPKHFATLKAVDARAGQATLLIDGEILPKIWPLAPDAEIKVSGWWGRLSDFTLGDRVWVWFKTDRRRQPVSISMIADEISQQDINGAGVTVERTKDGAIKIKSAKGAERVVKSAKDGPSGNECYIQTAGDQVRLVLDKAGFERRREDQKKTLRQRWISEGLPGTVAFVHVFSGEMDLMLDHEAMRWGRTLAVGDKVTLAADPPIKGLVKHVQAWRERTQVRLVVHSFDLADLAAGQRLSLLRTPPTEDVDTAIVPPDIDRPRSKPERIEWFLANIYCTCGVMGDRCTGHFYTLASCNPNACGMPNHMRKYLGGKMDAGMSDRQIFEELARDQGPTLLKPHLLP